MKKILRYWRLHKRATELLNQADLMVRMMRGNAELGQTAKLAALIEELRA